MTSLTEILSSLFGRSGRQTDKSDTKSKQKTDTTDEPDAPPRPSSPLVVDKYDGLDPVEVNLYRTPNVAVEACESVAVHVQQAFEDIFMNVHVEWGFELQDPPVERDLHGTTARWWRDQAKTDEARTANILLVDHPGGGGTFGNDNVVGAKYVDEFMPPSWYGRGVQHGTINAALHEIGHSLAVGHDMDPEKPGNQHTGVAWRQNGEWWRTPNVAGNDTDNYCGRPIPNRPDGMKPVHVHKYSPCFAAHLERRKT